MPARAIVLRRWALAPEKRRGYSPFVLWAEISVA